MLSFNLDMWSPPPPQLYYRLFAISVWRRRRLSAQTLNQFFFVVIANSCIFFALLLTSFLIHCFSCLSNLFVSNGYLRRMNNWYFHSLPLSLSLSLSRKKQQQKKEYKKCQRWHRYCLLNGCLVIYVNTECVCMCLYVKLGTCEL